MGTLNRRPRETKPRAWDQAERNARRLERMDQRDLTAGVKTMAEVMETSAGVLTRMIRHTTRAMADSYEIPPPPVGVDDNASWEQWERDRHAASKAIDEVRSEYSAQVRRVQQDAENVGRVLRYQAYEQTTALRAEIDKLRAELREVLTGQGPTVKGRRMFAFEE